MSEFLKDIKSCPSAKLGQILVNIEILRNTPTGGAFWITHAREQEAILAELRRRDEATQKLVEAARRGLDGLEHPQKPSGAAILALADALSAFPAAPQTLT